MADPMTMEHARRLAAQDCPLPSLSGPALRLLVERIDLLENGMREAAQTLEMGGEQTGVARVLRMLLNEPVRTVGIDMAGDEDAVGVAVARVDGDRLHIEHIIHWPRRAGRTHAQLVALSAALQLYPYRNTHQLQARKVCTGVSALAAELLAAGFPQGRAAKPCANKARCPDFPNCPNLGCRCEDKPHA